MARKVKGGGGRMQKGQMRRAEGKGGSAGKKARKRMGTVPEQLKKHRITEYQKWRGAQRPPPKAPSSFLEAAERLRLAQGHTTSFNVSSDPNPRPHDPQLLIWLASSRFGWGNKGFPFGSFLLEKILASSQSIILKFNKFLL